MVMTTDNNSLVLGGDNPSMPEGFFDEKKLFEDGEGTTTGQVETPKVDDTQPDTSNDVITINRKELQATIDKLRLEDADFAQVYNRDIGNKAAQRYKPEIDTLRKQNEALALAVKQSEYSRLSPEEVNEKFKTDPAFARDYADVTHREVPVTREPTIEQVAQVAAPIIQNILGFAEQMLPADKLEALKQDISSGKFDVDETGQQYGVYNWREGVDRLQRTVVNMSRPSDIVIPPPDTKPVVVPKVDTAKPDMSNGGGNGSQRSSMKISEFRKLPWEEQFKMYPNDGDIDKAVERGELTI